MNNKIIVEGPQKVKGIVKVSGAKNSILPLMCASLLSGSQIKLTNVPLLNDVKVLNDIINKLGRNSHLENYELTFDYVENLAVYNETISEDANRIRYSVLLLGTILAVKGRVKLPLPGGCSFSDRPIDIHLDGLKQLGAEIKEEDGFLIAEAKRLIGTDMTLRFPSVGATENLLIASVLAEGVTYLRNIAKEPEIVDLINFLNKLGAQIEFISPSEVKVTGVKELTAADTIQYEILPDRIEAATFFILGALAAEDYIIVENLRIEHSLSFLNTAQELGVKFEILDPNTVKVYKINTLEPVYVETGVYPGLATDIQPMLAVLLSQADGVSTIKDSIYPTRFQYGQELNKMNGNIEFIESGITIKGESNFSGSEVFSHDLRGGAAVLLAALIANGKTEIDNTYQIFRGYSQLKEKLESLGVVLEQEVPLHV